MGGHGGMDYIMLYRLLECVRQGIVPDMDVYDAAAWSSVAELSIQSGEPREQVDGIPGLYTRSLAVEDLFGHRNNDVGNTKS